MKPDITADQGYFSRKVFPGDRITMLDINLNIIVRVVDWVMYYSNGKVRIKFVIFEK